MHNAVIKEIIHFHNYLCLIFTELPKAIFEILSSKIFISEKSFAPEKAKINTELN